MDRQTSIATPKSSPATSGGDQTPSPSPTIGLLSPTPCPYRKATLVEDDASKASSTGQTQVSLQIRTVTPHVEVTTPPQSLPQSPEPRSPASGLPRVIVVYQNGYPSRLRSVYDKNARKYIYHHTRDRHRQIRMTFVQGKVESIEDVATKDLIYVRGVTHKPTTRLIT
ncbi:uncharacterized protein F4812DRAFT_455042 [Daldinia caldariorum]|uniref:uncharacterized protein n=1 Tax=Daldinia caldariorum TaxID=326644 RepID=UPI002008D564|nr:uncharacterized protein F4812DRAFT_455042 [Daldinia caldariorum]KAI1473227.1 hypothetical protein F4812DRAFT_455042 [Daldinia caldariorum]